MSDGPILPWVSRECSVTNAAGASPKRRCQLIGVQRVKRGVKEGICVTANFIDFCVSYIVEIILYKMSENTYVCHKHIKQGQGGYVHCIAINWPIRQQTSAYNM